MMPFLFTAKGFASDETIRGKKLKPEESIRVLSKIQSDLNKYRDFFSTLRMFQFEGVDFSEKMIRVNHKGVLLSLAEIQGLEQMLKSRGSSEAQVYSRLAIRLEKASGLVSDFYADLTEAKPFKIKSQNQSTIIEIRKEMRTRLSAQMNKLNKISTWATESDGLKFQKVTKLFDKGFDRLQPLTSFDVDLDPDSSMQRLTQVVTDAEFNYAQWHLQSHVQKQIWLQLQSTKTGPTTLILKCSELML